jgi:protease-4
MNKFLQIIFALSFASYIIPPIIEKYKEFDKYRKPHIKVGVLKIDGAITESNSYIKQIVYLFEKCQCNAILIAIDSPGGAAGSSQAIYNEIKYYKKRYNIPVVCIVENVCASGGYYIASACDYIISTPSAFIGSIGAYISFPYVKEFIEQFKLKYNFIKAGEYKTSGNPFTDLTPEQKEMFQIMTDNVYNKFTSDVLESRPNLDKDKAIWAEGKIFTGEQALNLKLIDELGSRSTAISTLKMLCKVDESYNIIWKKYQEPKTFIETLLNPKDQNQFVRDSKNSLIETIVNKTINILEKKYINNNIQDINL